MKIVGELFKVFILNKMVMVMSSNLMISFVVVKGFVVVNVLEVF